MTSWCEFPLQYINDFPSFSIFLSSSSSLQEKQHSASSAHRGLIEVTASGQMSSETHGVLRWPG